MIISCRYGYITTTPKPLWANTNVLGHFDCFDVPKVTKHNTVLFEMKGLCVCVKFSDTPLPPFLSHFSDEQAFETDVNAPAIAHAMKLGHRWSIYGLFSFTWELALLGWRHLDKWLPCHLNRTLTSVVITGHVLMLLWAQELEWVWP